MHKHTLFILFLSFFKCIFIFIIPQTWRWENTADIQFHLAIFKPGFRPSVRSSQHLVLLKVERLGLELTNLCKPVYQICMSLKNNKTKQKTPTVI